MEPIYIVTDGEFDGPVPGRHSLLSFASVAVSAQGETRGSSRPFLRRWKEAIPTQKRLCFGKTIPPPGPLPGPAPNRQKK